MRQILMHAQLANMIMSTAILFPHTAQKHARKKTMVIAFDEKNKQPQRAKLNG